MPMGRMGSLNLFAYLSDRKFSSSTKSSSTFNMVEFLLSGWRMYRRTKNKQDKPEGLLLLLDAAAWEQVF